MRGLDLTSFSHFSQKYNVLGTENLSKKIMRVKFSIKMVLTEIYSGVLVYVLQTCHSGMIDPHFLATNHLKLNVLMYCNGKIDQF